LTKLLPTGGPGYGARAVYSVGLNIDEVVGHVTQRKKILSKIKMELLGDNFTV